MSGTRLRIYNPATHSYYQYPTTSNLIPNATQPPGGLDSANYGNVVGNGPTNVGAYTLSASPYGAFDMGGNVEQWDEASFQAGPTRDIRRRFV